MQTVYEDDVVVIKFEVHEKLGLVIHIDIKEWRKRAYVNALRVFKELTNTLTIKNIDHVSAAIPLDDEKNKKFALMFGFEETDLVLKNKSTSDITYGIWLYTMGDR